METNKKRFKGTWLPAVVHQYFEDGKITAIEMVLLSTVDALSDEDEGCYASNEWLAEKLRMKPNSVGDMVSRLVKVGMLHREVKRGQRGSRRWLRVWYDPTPVETGVRTPVAAGVLPLPTEGDNRTQDEMVLIGDDMKGFFEQFDHQESDYDHLAQALHDQLKSHGLLPKKWSLQRWANDIGIAFRRHDNAQEVFTHLLGHITHERMPTVRSGKSFKEKFENIERNMTILQAGNWFAIPISEQTTSRLERLRMKRWEHGSDDHLAAAVELSEQAYGRLRVSIVTFHQRSPAKLKRHKYRETLMNQMENLLLRLPQLLVSNYFDALHSRLHNWDDWSGDLKPWILTGDKLIDELRRVLPISDQLWDILEGELDAD